MESKEAVDGENANSAKECDVLGQEDLAAGCREDLPNYERRGENHDVDVAECKTIGALPCACLLVMYITYLNISIP